jgi:hypothetical protein
MTKENHLSDVNSIMFANIINIFSNLKFLNYDPFDCPTQRIEFSSIRQPIFSSTLLELRVNVLSFQDCLYLLDGRFSQLRLLDVKIRMSLSPSSQISQVGFEEMENYLNNNHFDFD